MSATGIIPAHAGNTHGFVVSVPQVQDHPRACGEHATTAYAATHDLGSSPRMRGTHQCGEHYESQLGIIPAHAGNTRKIFSSAGMRWDHPRACGEHLSVPIGAGGSWGSSPRMRGTHAAHLDVNFLGGIIPAHAGNTSEDVVCRFWDTGSSPRTRGTLRSLQIRNVLFGIIPAHAGNTRGSVAATVPSGDHPRACGEHAARSCMRTGSRGSSPRMRGTHHERP